ncbi:MAG: alanine--glyoxylate aminotransferase family protein [Verrucomicrobiae bacterium]|nr:alanine--glyoxylate aminotransferase family protein [Verrucomicrobiae bacterium]
MKTHNRLYIPGPVEVSEKTFEAFCQPMIGHRSAAFQELYASVQPKLQQVFHTRNPVFVSTSSAWGVMEAAIRNLTRPGRKVLCCMNGAFSDKWYDVAVRNGLSAEKVQVEWGQPILPEQVEAKLKQGDFDVVTMIHNETSTGVMSPVAEIAKVVRAHPETLFVVDAVSSMTGVRINMDAMDLDVLLCGVQKAFALPPGLALFAVSKRALERAKQVPNRGYYFDFLEFLKNHESNMTPSTPSVSHIYALQSKLDEMLAEGLDARYERHRIMAEMVRSWACELGFGLFPRKGYESLTLTCAANTRNEDIPAWIKRLRETYHCVFDGGYGKLKGKTFRIAHMGDETPESIRLLLGWLNDTLSK